MRILFLLLVALLIQPSLLLALTLSGTGDSQDLLRLLATAYQHQNPSTEIKVPPSVGSSGGIRLLLENRTDLARVARPLTRSEVEQGLESREFARVPILFVANLPQACVSDLSSQQIIKIFTGQISNWAQLGDCPNNKIYLARRETGDSSSQILKEQIAGLGDIQNPVGKTIYTTHETFAILAKYPYALGYLPASQISDSVLTRFSYNGVAPTLDSVSSGAYPLQLSLSLVWQNSLNDETRKFLQFLNGAEAQQCMRTFGALPVILKNL